MLTRTANATPAHHGRHILIHYDGSCFGNPGPGGHAAVIRHMDGTTEIENRIVRGREAGQTTNNRMEMIAAATALEAINPREEEPIIIYGDSNLVSKGMNEWMSGWIKKNWKGANRKPVRNRDLWDRLTSAAEGKNVEWRWVKGHAGNRYNEEVDQIARAEMEQARAQAESFRFAA